MPEPYRPISDENQQKIIDGVQRGLTDAQIGEELGIEARSVSFILRRIRRKRVVEDLPTASERKSSAMKDIWQQPGYADSTGESLKEAGQRDDVKAARRAAGRAGARKRWKKKNS